MAGSPPVAERLGLSTFHFVNRQVHVPRARRRGDARGVASCRRAMSGALALLVYVDRHGAGGARRCSFGAEVKGARRWITLAGIGLQPSEFVKPAFVVIAAWVFAEGGRRTRHAGQRSSASCSCSATIVPLDPAARFRPDHADHDRLGRAVLHGRPALVLGRSASAAPASLGIFAAYRCCRMCAAASTASWISRQSGDTFQIDTAIEAFVQRRLARARARARAR